MKFYGKKVLLWVALVALFIVGASFKGGYFNKVSKVFKDSPPKEIIEPYSKYPMSVHFLDVGKADCIFISCDGKNILIDSGDKNIENVVTEYLERHSVEKLDLVVVTHPHRDHIGQMSEVVKKFNIVRFIMPRLRKDIVPTMRTYENLLKSLDEKSISPQEPISGSNFEIGKMNIQIFGPNAQYDNINNYSIVIKITYGKKSFLFTGDAEKESEKDMIKKRYNLKSDVLKVGHHGSKTSTTQDFLNKVDPEYAVISVGSDRNDLPKKEILNRIERNHIKVLRTDESGNLIFSTDGEDLEIFKER